MQLIAIEVFLFAGLLLLIFLIQMVKDMVDKQIESQIKKIIPIGKIRKIFKIKIKFK